MTDNQSTKQKPVGIKKLALDTLDRILFIGIGAVGAVAASPSGAHDSVALRVEGDDRLLNDARIKLVNDDYEGDVGSIEGL